MNRKIIDGKQILVEIERERSQPGWIPRRLGGGLGGRKESGQLRFGGRDRPHRLHFKKYPRSTRKHSSYTSKNNNKW